MSKAENPVIHVLDRMVELALGESAHFQSHADALHVPYETVKSWKRRRKVPLYELEMFSERYGVTIDWLLHGDQEFHASLDTVALATQQAVAAELTPEQADVYQRVMLASKKGDVATLKQLVISLSRDENEMLENYRRCSPTSRRALLTSSAAMAVAVAEVEQQASATPEIAPAAQPASSHKPRQKFGVGAQSGKVPFQVQEDKSQVVFGKPKPRRKKTEDETKKENE